MNQTEYQNLVQLSQQEVDENAKALEGVLTAGATFDENHLNLPFVSEHLTYLMGVNDVLGVIANRYSLKPQFATQAVRLNKETCAAEFYYTREE